MKKAFLTGPTGQVGSYLAELLLEKGYEVHGLVRRSSTPSTSRIAHLGDLRLHYGDLADGTSLVRLVSKIQPDDIYHLGAQSDVRLSFDAPEYAFDVNATGTMRLLEAARIVGVDRFYNAATSELFGGLDCPDTGYTEESPLVPRSPYGASKIAAYWATRNYREAYGMHACSGFVFNTESERRGENFVTKKIARAVARIEWELDKELKLGNLEARRDWSYAPEVADAIFRITQHRFADDFVIATGVAHSVQEFCEAAFEYRGLNWRDYVRFDPNMLRPSEVPTLIGDASKAKRELGWTSKVGFGELVKKMVDHEAEAIELGQF